LRKRRRKMKDINYYMCLPYRLELLPDTEEGGYAAKYPDLPGCITVGDTMMEALANAEDAKRAWIEAQLEDGTPIPEPVSADRYSGQFKLRLPKTLHKALAEHAKQEGISLNQYCLYLLAGNDAVKYGK
jgi:predicted RNase H-like HicB family nuclease